MLKEKLWFHETITETDILGVFLMASTKHLCLETIYNSKHNTTVSNRLLSIRLIRILFKTLLYDNSIVMLSCKVMYSK